MVTSVTGRIDGSRNRGCVWTKFCYKEGLIFQHRNALAVTGLNARLCPQILPKNKKILCCVFIIMVTLLLMIMYTCIGDGVGVKEKLLNNLKSVSFSF